MKSLRPAALIFLGLSIAACDSSLAKIDPEDHENQVFEWREERLANLMAEDGFLNLAGLYWLKDGETSFGSDAANDVRFPAKAASVIGTFELTEDGVMMSVMPGVDVHHDGAAVTSLLLADDTTDKPVTVTHRTLAWVVIKRSGRYGVRLRDFENPVLSSFPTLQYFPIASEFRVQGKLLPYDEPRIAQVDTVIPGLGWEPESPGVVEFEMDGKRHELEAYTSGDELFFVFGDTTNGRSTYPAGRFLYADAPDSKGLTILDFNQAYSPPCAFNDFSTCPVATPGNRLKVAIEAGEKFDPVKQPGLIATH